MSLLTSDSVDRKTIEEAKIKIYNALFTRNDKILADAIQEIFGKPTHLCNESSPQFNLPCLKQVGHEGDHHHFPFSWEKSISTST